MDLRLRERESARALETASRCPRDALEMPILHGAPTLQAGRRPDSVLTPCHSVLYSALRYQQAEDRRGRVDQEGHIWRHDVQGDRAARGAGATRHRTRTARAPRTARAIYQPKPRTLPPQVALFGECVLSEDSTPSNCQKLEEALSELQTAIETCSVDAPEDCDTEEVATELKEDKAPEVAVAKPAAKSGAKRRAVKNLLHMLTLGLFKTKLSPYQAPTYLPTYL